MSTSASEPSQGQPLTFLRRPRVRQAAMLVLALVCAWIVIGLVGAINWDAVYSAMRQLHVWQFAVLVLVLVVRQVFNALPLAMFIEGLSVFRATAGDQAATLTSMVAPPPADVVLRVAILKSWGVPPSVGLAASTMNTLSFYTNRFLAPTVGFLIILPVRFVPADAIVAAVCLVIAAVILALTIAVVRQETAAERVGLNAGRLAARVRKDVEPADWAASTMRFRSHIAGRLRTGLPRALGSLLVMVVLDATLLLLAIRFVGISSGDLSTPEVLSTYLVLFPLTLFPLAGLGVLDAAVVAALTEIGGIDLEAQVVAGLVVYRVVTLVTPMILGGIALAYWKRTTPPARVIEPQAD